MADGVTRFKAGETFNAARDVALLPGGAPNVIDVNVEPLRKTPQVTEDGLLDVGDLCRMFEESEESTYTARQHSERDRDYYDSKQWTDAEERELAKRGQPALIDNRIKTKIDFLIGLEKQHRIDPRALPRTPQHEQDADAASQALKYVADTEGYDTIRSGAWRNLLIEGAAGISVSVEEGSLGYGGMMSSTSMTQPEVKIKLRRVAWDRMFADPHSSEPDYSDAGYLGTVLWMDYADALAMYPDGKDALEYTLSNAPSDTYDDKPKWGHWADKKRKRVRICQIWVKRDKEWFFAEYTKGGILKAGPSPYKTDTGESDCELFFQSAYVDRDNNRYGLVREMITLQDGINKRKSKSLHLLNSVQTMYEDGAIDDIDEFARQAQRPDGRMKTAPGALTNNSVKVETRLDLAATHFQLLQEDQNSIDLKGPNATMMGDKAQGSAAASGRAILASQQGGMIQLGDLLDHLRSLDKRVFRAIWNRVRQYWTAEKWVRTTDDEQNVKWVAMNVDPQMLQQLLQSNPQAAEQVAGVVSNVAQLDCDIIIDEVPDSVTPAIEQWQGLVDLANAGVTFPPEVYIKSAPNLRNKGELLDALKQPNPAREAAQEVEMAGAVAKVKETESRAALNMARAGEAVQPEMQAPPQADGFELPPDLQVARELSEIENTQAQTDYTRVRTMLEPVKARQQAQRAQQMRRLPQGVV